jgi:hypothetical protein
MRYLLETLQDEEPHHAIVDVSGEMLQLILEWRRLRDRLEEQVGDVLQDIALASGGDRYFAIVQGADEEDPEDVEDYEDEIFASAEERQRFCADGFGRVRDDLEPDEEARTDCNQIIVGRLGVAWRCREHYCGTIVETNMIPYQELERT